MVNKSVSVGFLNKLSELQQELQQQNEVKGGFDRVLSLEEILISEIAGFTHYIKTIHTKDCSVIFKANS